MTTRCFNSHDSAPVLLEQTGHKSDVLSNLFKLVNNMFQTCSNTTDGKTICEQACYNLFSSLIQLVRFTRCIAREIVGSQLSHVNCPWLWNACDHMWSHINTKDISYGTFVRVTEHMVFVETLRKFFYRTAFDPLARIFISANNNANINLYQSHYY